MKYLRKYALEILSVKIKIENNIQSQFQLQGRD